MDAKFQTEGMNRIGEWLEAGAIRGGGKTVGRRQQAAKFIHCQRGIGAGIAVVVMRAGIGPAIIHDHRVPAERLHFLRNVMCIRQHLGLDDVVAERIVAVPAHRRRGAVRRNDFDFAGFANEFLAAVKGIRPFRARCDDAGAGSAGGGSCLRRIHRPRAADGQRVKHGRVWTHR